MVTSSYLRHSCLACFFHLIYKHFFTEKVQTGQVKLSVLALSFTLQFLNPLVSNVSFYILIQMSGGNYGTGRGSFCFLRMPVLKQLAMTVSWNWIQSVFGVHSVSVLHYHIPRINKQSLWTENHYKLTMYLCSYITKFLDQHRIKITNVGRGIVRQYVRQLQNNFFRA